MPWPSSWLPFGLALPTWDLSYFKLPSTVIQSRFISYILKRTLGHLFKAGQLDLQQIDSQIGSGFVDVKDLELDPAAINALLAGLPLHLSQGRIGKVTVRIPWPNPLTSSVGFSLDRLHLTLRMVPQQRAARPQSRPLVDLADSVSSLAQSFIYEELSPAEEMDLYRSVHSDRPPAPPRPNRGHVPGGLDPFIHDDEEYDQGAAHHDDMDPEGVSIFASLVESLVARFNFDATDTSITIEHEGHARFTVHIPRVNYATQLNEHSSSASELAASAIPDASDQKVTRSLTIDGLTVSLSPIQRPLSPRSPSPTSLPRTSSPTMSSQSDSDMDEDTQMMMSQAIFLPPRPASPPGSVASSMYQSAMMYQSAVSELVNEEVPGLPASLPQASPPAPTVETPPETPTAERVIVSLSVEPLLIQLTTRTQALSVERSPMQLSVSMGTLACAFDSESVRCSLEATQYLSTHTPSSPQSHPAPSAEPSAPASVLRDAAVNLHVRSFTVLFLGTVRSSSLNDRASLSAFFERPFTVPQLSFSYCRFHAEGLHATSRPSTPSSSSNTYVQQPFTHPASSHRQLFASPSFSPFVTFVVSEISLLAFVTGAHPTATYTMPILITDPHLGLQYPATHRHPLTEVERTSPICSFNVTLPTPLSGWNPKVSAWRTKAPPQTKRSSVSAKGDLPSAPQTPRRNLTGLPVEESSIGGIHRVGSPPVPSGFRPAPLARSPEQLRNAFTTPTVEPSRVAIQATASFDPRNPPAVDIKIEPLQLFLDVSLLPPAISFLESAIPSADLSSTRSQHIDLDEGNVTPPATPRAGPSEAKAYEREKERQRLEQSVMDDLNLGLDYRQSGTPTQRNLRPTKVKARKTRDVIHAALRIPIIRVQMSCPPPLTSPSNRSGAVVLDLHQLTLYSGALPKAKEQKAGRFFQNDEDFCAGSVGAMASTEWSRFIIGCTSPNESRVTVLLSMGPLSTADAAQEVPGSTPTRRHDYTIPSPLLPRLFFRTTDPTGRVGSLLALDIPSVHVYVPKSLLDGLQLWADDISQFLERQFGGSPRASVGASTQLPSRNPSLIGSRYFTKQRWTESRSASESDSGSGLPPSPAKGDPFTARVSNTEVLVCLSVPRESLKEEACSFEVSCFDLGLTLESNAEGKGDMVVSVDVVDVRVSDHFTTGNPLELLSLTGQRNLSSIPRPMIKLQFTSAVVPHTTAKESRIRLTLSDFTLNTTPNTEWMQDLARFTKSPPGAFESVVPSERTVICAKIMQGSIRASHSSSSGAALLAGDFDLSTTLVGESPETSIHLFSRTMSVFFLDELEHASVKTVSSSLSGGSYWAANGYPIIADLSDLDLRVTHDSEAKATKFVVDGVSLRIHLCADTISGISNFFESFAKAVKPKPTPAPVEKAVVRAGPTSIGQSSTTHQRGIMASLDDQAFRATAAEIGLSGDLITDDLPSNLDYLDASFGPAAGLRELLDEDLDDFAVHDEIMSGPPGVVSNVGGETIKFLANEPLRTVEHYFDTLPPESEEGNESAHTELDIRIQNADAALLLYDGYDSARIRKIIEEKAKEMRRKLAKIRQLLSEGQTYDASVEDTSALLFNSVHLGLDREELFEVEPIDIIAAIDNELELNNAETETISQSSWQSFQPAGTAQVKPLRPGTKTRRNRLERSHDPSIEFRFTGLDTVHQVYPQDSLLSSRILTTIRDFEILDHIKTSTWKKFLTDLRADSHGNVRETGSNMVRVELRVVRPAQGHSHEEARLKAKLLPLRLHVDQDALDFLKAFFAFKDSDREPVATVNKPSHDDIYFQHAEVFPVGIKLDYKPRRVDYKALKDGRTIELMNFFHFDGAEMILRHITLSGITGWPRLFDTLNDLWTPDVKANQLADIISGVSPIRSVVNVGSGVADLVLLPIAQYRKDGRVVRGLQKGTAAFVKSSAMEAIKLGAQLATGTQVILEKAENVLGGQFKTPITAEAMQTTTHGGDITAEELERAELISRYAEQPTNVKEGVQSAYKSLSKNLNAAAQTILAVPMEVYERSGNEGPVRAVVRAVPIAILKPMIGASEAVSKTLLGLQNTMDPSIKYDAEDKYKHR